MPNNDSDELLRVKEEMLGLWERLPAEHQASMLLMLLEKSAGGDWAVQTHLFKKEQKGGSLEPPPW